MFRFPADMLAVVGFVVLVVDCVVFFRSRGKELNNKVIHNYAYYGLDHMEADIQDCFAIK